MGTTTGNHQNGLETTKTARKAPKQPGNHQNGEETTKTARKPPQQTGNHQNVQETTKQIRNHHNGQETTKTDRKLLKTPENCTALHCNFFKFRKSTYQLSCTQTPSRLSARCGCGDTKFVQFWPVWPASKTITGSDIKPKAEEAALAKAARKGSKLVQTSGPVVQWSSGPMDQWTSGPVERRK